MAEAASPFAPAAGGVRIRIRLTPRASRERIEGTTADAEGGVALKAFVTAVPEAGKANDALLRLLAKTWRLPRTALSVVAGAADRRKVVLAAGDPAELMKVFSHWMDGIHD